MDVVEIISSGLVVIFLVQQAKRWVRSDFLPLVSIAIGIIIQVLNDTLMSSEPITAAMIWASILTGFMVGAGASGAYDLAGNARAVIKPARVVVGSNSNVEVVAPEIDPDNPDPLKE